MPGRHRSLHRTGLVVTASALAVIVITGGAWAGYQEFSGRRCSATVNLSLAVAPEVAPAVKAAADTWVKGDDAKVGTECVAVSVSAADSTAQAAAVGSKHGVNLGGAAPGKEETRKTAALDGTAATLGESARVGAAR